MPNDVRPIACRVSRVNADCLLLELKGEVIVTESDAHLVSLVATDGVRGIVWELSGQIPLRAREFPPEVLAAAHRLPLFVLAEPSLRHCREVVKLSAVVPTCGVWRDARELASHLRDASEWPDVSTAECEISRRVVPLLDERCLLILVVATVMSKRRTSVRALASACGLSSDAVEYRLRGSAGPEPRELLGGLLALHAVWCHEMLGWSVKRVALAFGFATSAALSNYVHSHTGGRLRELVSGGGFFCLLETLEMRWSTQCQNTMRRSVNGYGAR